MITSGINVRCLLYSSAGVGRTGTYIAVDVNLEQAKHEGIIDVHNFVQLMRTQRVNMVQTLVSLSTYSMAAKINNHK